MEPFLAALFGALVGAIGPVVVVHIQTQAQKRETLWKSALQAAEYDHNVKIELAKKMNVKAEVGPVLHHMYYYIKMYEALGKGDLDAKTVEQIYRDSFLLGTKIEELSQQQALARKLQRESKQQES